MNPLLFSVSWLILFLSTDIGTPKEDASLSQRPISNTEFKTLIWADEFEEEGAINAKNWFHQTKLPPWGSWFGGLINHYTNRIENSYVDNGYLNLVAIKESFEDQGHTKEYTSARLNSKFAFTYGRVEFRAKMPSGVGTWPAIWMLNKEINEDGAYWQQQGFGKTNWPDCGEIDILEHWGSKQDSVQSAVHTKASHGHEVTTLGGQKIIDASDQFHTYSLVWTSEKMVFSVDGTQHYEYNPKVRNDETWPFDSDQYFLLNIAIEPNIEANFKKSAMQVDYIRVYQ